MSDGEKDRKDGVELIMHGADAAADILSSMISCPAGSFTMGSPEDEEGRRYDETQHQVTLSKPFWIGKYKVTQAQYEAVIGNNQSRFRGRNLPVEQVSWENAMAFCEKLNELTEGKRPAGYQFSLPTEAQWEYACRAGTTGAFAGDLDSMGWYDENSNDETHDVGQKQPNAWGIYDMHGNVWEWCRDWYGEYDGDGTDPVGAVSGSYRVIRGCSRSARRDKKAPGYCSYAFRLGFRVALVPVFCAGNEITFRNVTDKEKLKALVNAMLKNSYDGKSCAIFGFNFYFGELTDNGFNIWEELGSDLKIDFTAPVNWARRMRVSAFDFLVYLKLCDRIVIQYTPDQGLDNELYVVEYCDDENISDEAPGVCHWQRIVPKCAIRNAAKSFFLPEESGYDNFNDYFCENDGKIVCSVLQKVVDLFENYRECWLSPPYQCEFNFSLILTGSGEKYLPELSGDEPELSRDECDDEFESVFDTPDAASADILSSMISCPAGSFTMGSPEDEEGRRNDETQHQVMLTKPFWIGKYPVTQAQYEAVIGNNPSHFKGSNRPVGFVSWCDAMAFCEKLNALTDGKRPAGYKFSLPTEAQWEYACRAGTTGAFAGDWDSMGWYDENSYDETHDVGQKQPNAWGIYDMHGNVTEWCRDWYGKYHGDETDPTGPASDLFRVRRGGGWYDYARDCRSARRGHDDPRCRGDVLGFRVALVPVQ